MNITNHLLLSCKLLQGARQFNNLVAVGSADSLIDEVQEGTLQLPEGDRMTISDVVGVDDAHNVFEFVHPGFSCERCLVPGACNT